MGYGIRLLVWGDYALFSRPEMKVERVSYDVMTPSAARGILEAIYWKPSIRWIIDSITVCSPIEFTNFRRNEVSAKISASNVRSAMSGTAKPLFLNTAESRQQRAAMVLRNVRYIINAHFKMTGLSTQEGDNKCEKHYSIAVRRMRQGQCFHTPYFGCREFPVSFRLLEENEEDYVAPELMGQRDLGFMLYDMDFSDPQNITPTFFRAVLRDGVLNLSEAEVRR